MERNAWIDLRKRKPAKRDGEFVLMWHVYQGAMVERRQQYRSNRFYSHWRPMPTEGWIDARERKPTIADSDVWHCVLTRHEIDGFKVTGWHQFDVDRYLTHWMPTPEPPPNYRELRNSIEGGSHR